jgi:hypothetical protein
MRKAFTMLLGVALVALAPLYFAPAASAKGRSVVIQVECGTVLYGRTGKNNLPRNTCLAPGAYLELDWHWNSGRFQQQTLVYQNDGNLVLYRFVSGQGYGTAIWASNTNGRSAGNAVLQNDGNFVLYDSNGRAYWSTNTWNCAGSWDYKQLDMQVDENLVLYFWPSNIGGKVAKWDRWGIARC